MLLDIEAIREITFGAVRIEPHEGYWRFFRFTPQQEKILDERGFSPRQYAAAGIKLDFYSLPGEVSFDFRIFPGSGRRYYAVDALVDGVNVHHHYKETNTDTDRFLLEIPAKSKKTVRITIYFPNVAGIELKNVTVPDGTVTPAKRKQKLLMVGDSITQGMDARHPQLSYANLLADAMQAELLNQGIGGDVFCEQNLDPSLPFKPSVVTVAYGVNDWDKKRENLSLAVDCYFKKAAFLYEKIPIFAILPIWCKGEEQLKNGLSLENVRDRIRDAAARNGIDVIETAAFVPCVPDYYYDGCVHPADLGFLFYGQALAKEIKKRRPDLFDITNRV